MPPQDKAVAGPNWTLLGIVAIVGIVALAGMMRPDRIGVDYDKGRFKGNLERHPLEARDALPTR